MKFQNSSIHGFKVMLCIKKRDERTEGPTDGRTNNPEAICPSNFFEVGGIKSSFLNGMKILWDLRILWESYGRWGPDGQKFCEILSHSVSYGMYDSSLHAHMEN